MAIEIPSTPANLAIPFADRLMQSGELDGFTSATPGSQQILVDLERFATDAEMLDRSYFVESYRSMCIPASFKDKEEVSYYNFGEGLTFEGTLATFGIVKVGRILGGNSVRALCLVFSRATLLPYMDEVEPDHLLYTPAYAVKGMSRTD